MAANAEKPVSETGAGSKQEKPSVEVVDEGYWKAIKASYSAQSVAEHSRVTRPFSYGGRLHVSMGGTGRDFGGKDTCWELRPPFLYSGKTYTYRESVEAKRYTREGERVTYHGREYILTNPIDFICAIPRKEQPGGEH